MNNIYQIYLISDSTGETLDRIFMAIKAQFKNIDYKYEDNKEFKGKYAYALKNVNIKIEKKPLLKYINLFNQNISVWKTLKVFVIIMKI